MEIDEAIKAKVAGAMREAHRLHLAGNCAGRCEQAALWAQGNAKRAAAHRVWNWLRGPYLKTKFGSVIDLT